ncbi:single-stranded DNA-binding protein [Aminomonas paucivorans]|uniref:single-stranded DNA-binding protein n=1 Tax=Aminomonas paucivorans TaxID=81412 RepID=UPI00332926E8
MSRGFNKVILMGNLAKDPDVRYTPSKQKVARITVAVGRQWKSKTGEIQNHTDFIQVVAWAFSADICEKYLRKGRPVLVEGRLSVRDFDDARTGQHRWVTEVVADSLTLLPGGKRDEEGEPFRASAPSYGAPRTAAPQEDLGSLRDEKGFGDEFPLDFSEIPDEGTPGDVDIPF